MPLLERGLVSGDKFNNHVGIINTLVSGDKFNNHVGIINSRPYILGGNMVSSVDQTSLDFLKPRRKKDDISTCTLEMILSK